VSKTTKHKSIYEQEGYKMTLIKRINKFSFAVLSVLCLLFASGKSINAQTIFEGFDDITTLTGNGWFMQNNSTPVGTNSWFQAAPGTASPFPSQSGANTSYIAANFNNSTGNNTISNWLLTPSRTFNNGDIIKFWTRTANSTFPDRLQVRMSANGTSTDVGVGSIAVGDFTTLLLDINPTYLTVNGYPLVWTEKAIVISGLSAPVTGRIAFRYFVEFGGPLGPNSDYIGIDTFQYIPFSTANFNKRRSDFDGDGKTDVSVYRPASGLWYLDNTGTGETQAQWGISTDVITPGDFDGDNKTDGAVFRASNTPSVPDFYIFRSSTGTVQGIEWGSIGDIPVVADYDGDNKDDAAVYRPSTNDYFVLQSSNGSLKHYRFGTLGDSPVPADYNGDGKTDFAVFRRSNGNWYIADSVTNAVTITKWGISTDIPVFADYDGDNKDDIAVYRPSDRIWYIRKSSGGEQYVQFGADGDIPVPGDYDGDGKYDQAVYRSGMWYLNRSTSGVTSKPYGVATDLPIPRYYLP
jgi:hypothetical protein